MGGDCCGAEVDGEAVDRAFVVAGPDLHDGGGRLAVALMDGDCDLPRAFAQGALQVGEHMGIGLWNVHIPLRFEGVAQALKVARRLVHIRLDHINIIELNRWIHYNIPCLSPLAHHLFVDLTFGRDVDDDVALDGGLAAETAALGEAAFAVVTLLNGVPFAERIVGDCDTVFGELAVGGGDLTFGTDATAATNRIKIDAELAGGCKYWSSHRKIAALA